MTELFQIRERRSLPTDGFALFEMGFRPFFLGAGAHAALSLPLWLAVHAGLFDWPSPWPAQWAHAHEMVFGFAASAVAGFLLTATPNWTSTAPVARTQLAALFSLWLAARVLFVTGAPVELLAAVDLSFLPALFAMLWPAIRRGKPKNHVFLALLAAMWGGNLLCHLELLGYLPGRLPLGLRAGVYAAVMMVTILSGRIVPGFTQNALLRRGTPHEAAATTTGSQVDLAAKAATLCTFASDLLALPRPLTGALAVGAAALLVLRMAGWRTRQILREPIVWILHAGHALIAVGLACLAVEKLTDLFAATTALHAFTAGVVGTMVLGIMTRASLGHTGRPLVVSRVITLAYVLVLAGALTRVFGPLTRILPYASWVVLSGTLWSLGFALFTLRYAPILWRPRAQPD